jgi:large subunit ribosomal protein L4
MEMELKMKAQVITLENKKVKEVDLPEALFGLEIRPDLLNMAVTYQLAKRRSGNHETKEIGDISGTGKKPWKQKGTGRARQGSLRSPQFRKGAVIFGPQNRDHSIDMPKNVRKLALKVALSSKLKENKLVILDEAKMSTPKTKELLGSLKKLNMESVLFIDGTNIDTNFLLASRNLPKVDVLPEQGSNVYDILRHDYLVMTVNALEQLGERLS